MEILDAAGQVIDTLPAGKRKGINRVYWSMQAKPPRVPSAAQASFAGTVGARVVPGNYRVRITKNGAVYEQALVIDVDRRADYNASDRAAHFAAAQKVGNLFGRMSTVVDRVNAVRALLASRRAALKSAAQQRDLDLFDAAIDAQRKLIVATKEGGAITGEERLRKAIAAETRFGVGAEFEHKRAHDVMDRDWTVSGITKHMKDKAWKQLGTSGSGNFGCGTSDSTTEIGSKT